MTDTQTGFAVLVIAGLGQWVDGCRRTEKIHTHVGPMVPVAERVTYLTIGPVPPDSDIDCRRLDPSGSRFVDFVRLGIAAVRLARTGRYDLITSFSLVPYGCFALLAKVTSGRPAHLGIIGMDLDVHAEGRAGWFVRRAFRRFDAISIAGSVYAERLIEMGVSPEAIHTILHPVQAEYADASRAANPAFDLVWVGRMSPEKDPKRFVRIVQTLDRRGVEVDAAMVGDGPSFDAIVRLVDETGLGDSVELVGWHPRPVDYYQRASLYVLTSEREMLPLTLVESMLVGIPAVTPPIGAIPDLVDDGVNGFLVDDRAPETYAAVIGEALADQEQLRAMGARARTVEDEISVDAVAESWGELFDAITRSSEGDSSRRCPNAPTH